MTEIHPDGSTAEAGRIRVRAPGMRGRVEALPPATPTGVRGAADGLDLDAVLAAHGVETTDAAYVDAEVVQEDALEARSGTRAAGTVEDPGFVTVEVDDPGEGWEQVLLVRDETTGTLSWAFANDVQRATDGTRGAGGVRRYDLRVTGNAPATTDGRRGVVGTIVRKLVKVLAFKVLDAAAGELAKWFVARWEDDNRRNEVLAVGDTLGLDHVRPMTDADWSRAGSGRALLFLHGTFSNTQGFAGLPAPTLAALRNRYPGGILAFDHFTLSMTPLENADWMRARLPRGVHLDVDVVCHSRGGLVGRALAENLGATPDVASALTVHRGVFVATPHDGTVLASTERMSALVDTFTNLFTRLPDNPVADGFAAVVEVVKQIAAGAVDEITGLQSMRPGGPFLRALNVPLPPADSRYFAVAANYEPADAGLLLWSADRVADAAFQSFENDLVVPTAGTYDANGSSRFPIADRYVFTTTSGIHHCNYFGDAEVSARLLEWLTPPG